MAKILAVDDSSSIRQMVTFTLQSGGHTVVQAQDGVDGLNAAKSDSFDLVITDVNMPNMDGITMIKELRSLPNYRSTPLLMLTTEAAPELKMRARNAGATGWIVKPFNPVKLIKALQMVAG